MTKYIKTDTNIFEVIDQNELVYYVRSVKNKHKIYSKSKCNTIIKNMSDKLEELCDEFVVAYENGARIVYGDLEWAKNKASRSDTKNRIYGAIWINTGLKYVAQLDKNGELQLL